MPTLARRAAPFTGPTTAVTERLRAAGDATTSSHALAALAHDADAAVRSVAVRHPSLPPRTMLTFACSSDAATCAMLAENPAAPVAVVRLLARHDASEVRLAAVRHPRLDLTALERLAEDDAPLVRSVATFALAARLGGAADV